MAQTTIVQGGVPMASTTPAMQKLSEQIRRCIQDCIECANICEQTIAFCIEEGGKHAAPDHITVMRDCVESCLMAASMMGRSSRFSREHCELCADICSACADSCDQTGQSPQMKACADACRRCEESCRQMSV